MLVLLVGLRLEVLCVGQVPSKRAVELDPDRSVTEAMIASGSDVDDLLDHDLVVHYVRHILNLASAHHAHHSCRRTQRHKSLLNVLSSNICHDKVTASFTVQSELGDRDAKT